MKEQITYDDFDKVDVRVGTVISVKKNEKARKPSLIIEVDFGKEIGIKQSSAQITHYYNEENLKGKQVTLTYGRIGIKNPAQIVKKFKGKSASEDAKKYAETKIREKVNKGYIEK